MKRTSNIKTTFSIILISLLLFACGQEKDILTTNYIHHSENGELRHPIPYTPKDLSVQIPLSSTRYWQIRLFDSEKEMPSIIYHLNDTLPILLFDNLEAKEYTFKFKSEFQDSFQMNIFVDSKKEISVPEELTNYYLELTFDDSILSDFGKKDTIQLFYTTMGCFGGSRRKFNIYFNLDNLVISEKDTLIDISNFDENFKEFISEGSDVEEKYKGVRCTSSSLYIIKRGNEIFRTYDESCQWHGLQNLLTNSESKSK